MISHGIQIPFSLQLKSDGSWEIHSNNKVVSKESSSLLRLLPGKVTDDNVETFSELIDKLCLCEGNDDFNDILENKLEIRHFFTEDIVIETLLGEKLIDGAKVVRSVNCEKVVQQDGDSKKMCRECKNIRPYLLKSRSIIKNQTKDVERTSESSKVNIRKLTFNELVIRYENVQANRQASLRCAIKLHGKIKKLIDKEGVDVDSENGNILRNILETNQPSLEEGSPQWLLWQQQLEQASKKDNHTVRWHPLIIRWCLSIYHTSPAAYKQISSRRNKFLVLPHVNTLMKYLNFTESQTGFNPDIIERLVIDSDLADLDGFQKNVSLSFDEMKIKSGLVYRR